MLNLHSYIMYIFLPLRMKEDEELSRDDSHKYRFKKVGKKHCLIINEAQLEDMGMYFVYTNGGHSKGELEVEGNWSLLAWTTLRKIQNRAVSLWLKFLVSS